MSEPVKIEEVTYLSIWQEGVADSKAKLNMRTGEIYDIDTAEGCDHYEYLEGEQISIHGRVFDVVAHEDATGFDYCVDKDDLEVIQSLVAPIDQCDTETLYMNTYECPEDNTQWEDTADSMCNDRCPTCNKEIEPMTSEEI